MSIDRDAALRAREHPEVQRMTRDPRYQTDPVYHLSTEQLRQFLAALYRALMTEEVDEDLTRRLVNRVVYGNAQGVPLDALQVLGQAQIRLRAEGDGLGPLMPGDAVRETVPVRIEGPMDPATREKILRGLGGLTDEKQAAWLAEGGEERHHVTGPPPNAAAEPEAAARYRAMRTFLDEGSTDIALSRVTGAEPDRAERRRRDESRARRALRKIRGR